MYVILIPAHHHTVNIELTHALVHNGGIHSSMLGLIIRRKKYWHMTTLLSRVLSSLALCLWSLHPATAFTKDQLDIWCRGWFADDDGGRWVASTDALLKHIKWTTSARHYSVSTGIWPALCSMLPLLLHNQQASYRVHVIPYLPSGAKLQNYMNVICICTLHAYSCPRYCGNETSPEGIPQVTFTT